MKPLTGILVVALLAAGAGAYVYMDGQDKADKKAPTSQKAPAKGKQDKGKQAKKKPKKKQPLDTALPKDVLAAVDKGDFATVQTALTSFLKGRSIEPTDKASLQAAMLLEVLRETGVDTMNTFAADSKGKQAFLSDFARDAYWQELYLSAGLVPYQTDIGMNVLYRIWKEEQEVVENKKLAVALASVWGGGETAPKPALLKRNPATNDPVWRYNFFQKQAAKGKLHPNYKNLQPWELRFTVGIPAQDWDDRSFSWAAENINMPWDRYHSACWAAIYTDPSKFGDSVQSGEYGLPFPMESAAQSTHVNGGVCGAMSHLGCYAAMAHGIPAYTVGQPGHCAYGLRTERGKWIGGFGGPDGGMHNHIFGNQAPTSYLLMETVFGNDAAIKEAYRQSFCARAMEATGDKAGAEKAWLAALKSSPLHPFFRKQLHRLMLERGVKPDEAFEYLKGVIPEYKGNGMASVDMMAGLDPVIAQMDSKQKLALFDAMHKVIATTPSSWAINMEDMFSKQAGGLATDAEREKYMASVFGTYMNAKDATVFGKALEWAVKEFVQKDKAESFGKAFAKAASGAKKATADSKEDEARLNALRGSYNKAIFASEQARSIPAFQQLSQAATKVCGAPPAPGELTKMGEMQGKPAEPDGMFRISSTNQWDAPYSHRSIMTPQGGQSHTNSEEKPHFIVELADADKFISGCIIRKSNGSEGRMKKAVVYTSADGATWMEKARIDDMPKEWAVQFPDGTKGKWVKVEFDNTGGSNFAHLSHFVVFVK